MIALELQEIADAVGGELLCGAAGATRQMRVSGEAQTDSREIAAGGIFFARRGETSDGHDYASAAVKNGAALVIGERDLGLDVPQIIVADSDLALAAFAKYVVAKVRAAGRLKVVAITGSNGKTTTKNLVAAMLARQSETVASEKSFNNEVGAPLTMLRVTETTEFLVLEMGASAAGEIRYLCDLAVPDVAAVLMIGLSHIGGFGSIETTAATKREIIENLPATATAVLNAQDPRVAAMAGHTAAQVRWFGQGGAVSASDIEVTAAGTSFTLTADGESLSVHFPVLGEHHVQNALAATAIATACGASLQTAAATLAATEKPGKWRMEVTACRDDITLINDAYNASPDAMAAALKTLAQIGKPHGRTVAVLGAMSELGDHFGPETDRLGLLAVRLRISQLVVVGPDVRRMYISAINEGVWDESDAHYFAESDAAFEFLVKSIQPHDTVLVKSSNAAGLRFLGDKLVEALA
ncbi:MAG: UDP-N-acetylmuramoyl-tripeptide--D-alanyl-D-alanine ligase [Microbacteriaceae bacterium]|nr:UDP-N-acetylmuramoyl-tripeptide--D-alanyl-D-alanine ligase [Microbacteriaceae bacterium]